MASEADRHEQGTHEQAEAGVPELYGRIAAEIPRLGLPFGLMFAVVGEQALTVSLDDSEGVGDGGDYGYDGDYGADESAGAPPPAFALICDGSAADTMAVLQTACLDPAEFELASEAVLLVVDPSSAAERGRHYAKTGAVALADARFATNELANAAVRSARALGLSVPQAKAAEVEEANGVNGVVRQPAPVSHEARQENQQENHYETQHENRHVEPDQTEHENQPQAGSYDPAQESGGRVGARAEEGHQQAREEAREEADEGAAIGPDTAPAQNGSGWSEVAGERPSLGAGADYKADKAPEPRPTTQPGSRPEDDMPGEGVPEEAMPTGEGPDASGAGKGAGRASASTSGSVADDLPAAAALDDQADAADAADAIDAAGGPGRALSDFENFEDSGDSSAHFEHAAEDPNDSEIFENSEEFKGSEEFEGLQEDPLEDPHGPFSVSRERLYRIREALEQEADEGRALTPEQSTALEALDSISSPRRLYRSLRGMLGLGEDELDRLVADAGPPSFGRISLEDAAGLRRCPFPGVITIGNNKGGCGKTLVTVELAATLATMGRPAGSQTGLKVLLIEQNYANPDIRKRVAVPPGRRLGLTEYVADCHEAEVGGARLPDLGGYVSRVEGLETDNLYALFLAEDESEWRHKGKATSRDLESVYEAAADAGFDLIVVDFQNGLPQAGDLIAENISFWISVADVMYVVLNPSEAVEHGSTFLEGARSLVDGHASSCSLVPVFNQWRPERSSSKRWERGAIALGADYAIAPPEYIPSEYAAPDEAADEEGFPDGGPAYFHRIPADAAVPEFCLERRHIALESRRFKEPFFLLGLDALSRIKSNYAAYFEPDAAGASEHPGHTGYTEYAEGGHRPPETSEQGGAGGLDDGPDVASTAGTREEVFEHGG